MKIREDVFAYGLSFPDTYQDAPFLKKWISTKTAVILHPLKIKTKRRERDLEKEIERTPKGLFLVWLFH